MTAPEIRPATDDQVRAWHDLAATGLMIVPTTIVDSLVARIEADRAERESNNRAFAEMNAVFSAVMRAVRGEALSEFDESHGAVHEANALRAAAQERDRKIAELEQERDDDTALIRRLNATAAAQAEKIERLKKREAGLEDALRQFRKVLGPFATKSALALLDAALDAALKPESKE